MARAAILGRVAWRVATVAGLHDETPTARTIALTVPDWPGHLAGQHLDVRLTAEGGYSAARSYSIASPPSHSGVDITVERFKDGEVSPYLTQDLAVGDQLELLGPIGGWFVWRGDQANAVQLIAGGAGIVPLMAMIRTRLAMQSKTPFRLLYSVREPDAVFYRDELQALQARPDGDVTVSYVYTRVAPRGWPRTPGRIDAEVISTSAWPATASPACFVCGPTPFVETVATLLIAARYDSEKIKTERFGPTGERR
jgi:ferredoxin-NADP reductase